MCRKTGAYRRVVAQEQADGAGRESGAAGVVGASPRLAVVRGPAAQLCAAAVVAAPQPEPAGEAALAQAVGEERETRTRRGPGAAGSAGASPRPAAVREQTAQPCAAVVVFGRPSVHAEEAPRGRTMLM